MFFFFFNEAGEKYMGARTIMDLEKTACKFWPEDIKKRVVEENPIQQLVDTQDQFLSILKCADVSPFAWLEAAKTSSLPPNVFVKHLMVLSDVGGENLKRFKNDFDRLFPKKKFEFAWRGNEYEYKFREKIPHWSNPGLLIDKKHLFDKHPFTDAMIDVSMLLLWGASIIDQSELPAGIFEKCIIGQLIGSPAELEVFVKQRYLHVSRIIGGSSSNDAGHICEEACVARLKSFLADPYVVSGHHVPGVSQNGKDLVTFDVVVTNRETSKCCAIEISFQVTTNSVIERKALLAKNRQSLLHRKGHKVAYIIDGAGNFERKSAVDGIMRFSDCTVNFSDGGMKALANFIKGSI